MKFNLPLENFKYISSGSWVFDFASRMLMIKAKTYTDDVFIRADGVHVRIIPEQANSILPVKVHFHYDCSGNFLYNGKVFDMDAIDWSAEHKGEPFRFVEPPFYVEDTEMIRHLKMDEYIYVQNAEHTFVNLRDGTLHFMGGGKVVFLNCELDVYTW